MELAMDFLGKYRFDCHVFYDNENQRIIARMWTNEGIICGNVFDDPKNALVDFLTYLLDTCREIGYINLDLFKISKDEVNWMQKHTRYFIVKELLEAKGVKMGE